MEYLFILAEDPEFKAVTDREDQRWILEELRELMRLDFGGLMMEGFTVGVEKDYVRHGLGTAGERLSFSLRMITRGMRRIQ